MVRNHDSLYKQGKDMDLLVGASYADPMLNINTGRSEEYIRTWAVQYAEDTPSYIIAMSGMGVDGLVRETLHRLEEDVSVDRVVFMVPPLFRLDIEQNEEGHRAGAMLDLFLYEHDLIKVMPAKRKWIISGGIASYDSSPYKKEFAHTYKTKEFYVLFKDSYFALKSLKDHCTVNGIKLYLTSNVDPADVIISAGLGYVEDDVNRMLTSLDYEDWIRYNDNKQFIDDAMYIERGHPTEEQHAIIANRIKEFIREAEAV